MSCELGDIGAEDGNEPPAEHRLDKLGNGIDRAAAPRAVDLELGIVAQDGAVQLLKRGAGFDAELVDELSARLMVDLQRLRLASRAVQREHQVAAKSLAQRVFGDQGLQLGDELGIATHLEVGFEELFESYEPQFLEPGDLVLREVLVDEVRER